MSNLQQKEEIYKGLIEENQALQKEETELAELLELEEGNLIH